MSKLDVCANKARGRVIVVFPENHLTVPWKNSRVQTLSNLTHIHHATTTRRIHDRIVVESVHRLTA